MPPAKKGTRRPTPQRAERIAKALRLREAGATYEQIAQHTGVSITQVARDIDDGLQITIKEPAERLRATESRRLDTLTRALYKRASEGDLGAIDRLLKVMERRARLLGLDTPTSVNLNTQTEQVTSLLDQLLDAHTPQE